MDLKSIYEGKKFGEILFCEPLKDYTTWGIGGPADVLVKSHN